MNPPGQQLDIVAVAVTVAATVFSPAAAEIVGPYAVIFLGAALGSAWSASRLQLRTKWALTKYVIGMVLLALLVTVPTAVATARYVDGVGFNYLLPPVAIGIGALGADGIAWLWREGVRLVRVRLRGFLLQLLSGAPKDPPPGGAT